MMENQVEDEKVFLIKSSLHPSSLLGMPGRFLMIYQYAYFNIFLEKIRLNKKDCKIQHCANQNMMRNTFSLLYGASESKSVILTTDP